MIWPLKLLRKAQDLMDDVLKEGGEARKLGIALKGVEYGDQIVGQLMAHSGHMEKLYGVFQQMVSDPETKDSKFSKLIGIAKGKMQWFKKTKARKRGSNLTAVTAEWVRCIMRVYGTYYIFLKKTPAGRREGFACGSC